MSASILSDAKFFETNSGLRLRYVEHVIPKAKGWMFFVHGQGGSLSAWNDYHQMAADAGYNSIAVDLRAHALSDRPRNVNEYKDTDFAQDLVDLIQVKDLKKLVYVGHCFGGMIGMIVAAQHPELIDKLILISTSSHPSLFGKRSVIPIIAGKIFKGLAHVLPQGTPMPLDSYEKYAFTNDIDLRRFRADMQSTTARGMVLGYSAAFQFDTTQILEQIPHKTLVMCGKNDVIHPYNLSIEIAQKIPHATFKLLPYGGHIVVISHPKEVMKEIVEFLKD